MGQTGRGAAAAAGRPPTREDFAAGTAVSRFLRALHVLLRAARLYGKNHPKETESLEQAEKELRLALRLVSPVGAGVEHAGMSFRGRMLADPRGELKSLAEDLAKYEIHSIAFHAETHLGELGTLARLLDGSPGSRASLKSAAQGGGEIPVGAEWAALLGAQRIRGIRINAPLEEKKADAAMTSLLALLLGPEVGKSGANAATALPGTTVESLEELAAVLRVQEELAAPLEGLDQSSPQEMAQGLRSAFAEADPRATAVLVAAMHRVTPQAGEAMPAYFERLAERLAMEFVREELRSGRADAKELRSLMEKVVSELGAHGEPAGVRRTGGAWKTREAQTEELMARCWREWLAEPDADFVQEVLRGREIWCVLAEPLREFLERQASAGSEPATRNSRALLLNYARCLESEQFTARRTAAAGLSEMGALVETLWPAEMPAELARAVERALATETTPEVAGLLSAVADRLSRLAIRREDYSELERIVEVLERRPRGAQFAHLGSLAKKIFEEDRWQGLVMASLAHRPLHPALPRLLARDPEKLLDDFSVMLAGNGGPGGAAANSDQKGADALPAMARLLKAVGEPATSALVARVFDPRTPRSTSAAKSLIATHPERLLEVLPRALSGWDWNLQDMAVGELVRCGTPGCARAFLEALPNAHVLVVPMMLDEIGMARETGAVPALVEIAAGRNERMRDVYVRIKAVEALGRMQARESADLLRTILREKNGLTHVEPAGLRAAAEEALGLIENRPSSARVRTAQDALAKASLARSRPRRYIRIPLETPLTARIDGPQAASARVKTISLGGAFLESSRRFQIGDSLDLEIRTGLRGIRSTAVVRNLEGRGGGIEFVHMKQDEREKLRKLVNKLLGE